MIFLVNACVRYDGSLEMCDPHSLEEIFPRLPSLFQPGIPPTIITGEFLKGFPDVWHLIDQWTECMMYGLM